MLMKVTFFITYIMVDGWARIAGEIVRLKPLVMYDIKNAFLVKTEKDKEARQTCRNCQLTSSGCTTNRDANKLLERREQHSQIWGSTILNWIVH